MKILLVEDDPLTGESIAATLTAHHHSVDRAEDGATALELVGSWQYDLILLDVELPRLDGLRVCRELRSRGCTLPIALLTVHDSGDSIVRGLDAGADDYLVKPADPEQLLARIRALSRRSGSASVFRWKDLRLDLISARVTRDGKIVPLTAKEYSLLALFLQNPRRIFSRDTIVDLLWSSDTAPIDKTVTNLVKDLRRKLKAAGMTEEPIETVYGLGYRLKAEPNSAPSPSPERRLPTEPGKREKWLQGTARLADRFQESLEQRVTLLDRAIEALQTGKLEDDLRQQARAEAHRLAGGLGTFGSERGSIVARAIEQTLAGSTPLTGTDLDRLSEQFTELQEILRLSFNVLKASSPERRIVSNAAHPPTVLILNSDPHFIEPLRAELSREGLESIPISDWPSISEGSFAALPDNILLDLDLVADPDGIERWQRLKRYLGEAPVLVLSERDDLADRVLAARLGSDRFIRKSAGLSEICRAIVGSLSRTGPRDARVMVVDDDIFTLTRVTDLLEPRGFQVTPVVDPGRFWESLTRVRPDLLLLDLEMPGFNGIELCRVVRQEEEYGDLPVLAITSHTEREAIEGFFAAGADDLIAKPIVGPELLTRVLGRLDRARRRDERTRSSNRSTPGLDPLTGIADRATFETVFSESWRSAARAGKPIALILCEIDDRQGYQDRYGRSALDRCLQQVAGALAARIRPREDLVARYREGEFVIVLPDTDLTGALRVAERVRRAIADLDLPRADSPRGRVTLSMGITGTVPTPESSLPHPIEIARRELHSAGSNGGDTFCLRPYPSANDDQTYSRG